MSDATGSATGGQATTAATSTSAALAGTTQAATTTADTGTTTAATTTGTTQAATTTQTPAIPWLDGADEVTVGYATNKGWQSPKDVLSSYQNLEKLLGADRAGNTVIIPKDGADPKEWGAVFDRLGRPTGPDGYKVQMPAGGDEKLQTTVLAKFHELGLNKQQGEALASWWNEQGTAAQQAAQQAQAESFAREDAALKQEWGQAFTQQLAKAQVGLRALGLNGEAIDKVASALGHQKTMNLLAKVGAGLAEDSFESGQNPGFTSALTPGQAQAKINDLKADKDWSKRYLAGGAAEKAEMARLIGFAYPDQK